MGNWQAEIHTRKLSFNVSVIPLDATTNCGVIPTCAQ